MPEKCIKRAAQWSDFNLICKGKEKKQANRNTYIHTYIHTYIKKERQTDRQGIKSVHKRPLTYLQKGVIWSKRDRQTNR